MKKEIGKNGAESVTSPSVAWSGETNTLLNVATKYSKSSGILTFFIFLTNTNYTPNQMNLKEELEYVVGDKIPMTDYVPNQVKQCEQIAIRYAIEVLDESCEKYMSGGDGESVLQNKIRELKLKLK